LESALDSTVSYTNRYANCQSSQKRRKRNGKKRKVENVKKHKPNENGKGKNANEFGNGKIKRT
jgi:hypothetical protein